MTPDLIARSLLAAAPARGRFAGERPEGRAERRRAGRALAPAAALAPTAPDGPRAERRALASPSVRPPPLTPAERAHAAALRARVAQAICAQHESLAALIDEARRGFDAARG